MTILQYIFAIFLTPFRLLLAKLNDKSRNAAITACFAMLLAFYVAFFTVSMWAYLYEQLTMDHMICCIILFVVVIFSIRGRLKPVKWDPVLAWLIFLTGAAMTAISFMHPVGSGYRPFGLTLMFVFPCIYYVWNNRGDYDTLYSLLSAATAAVGLAYFVYCIYLVFRGEPLCMSYRVRAGMYNANLYSMVGMVTATSGIYMLLVRRESVKWFCFSAASIGCGVTMVLLGASRASLIVIAGAFFCFVIFYFKTRKDMTVASGVGVRLLRAAAVILAIVLFLFAGMQMVKTHTAIVHRMQAEESGTEYSEEADDSIISDSAQRAADRYDLAGTDVDSFTSGRIHIWKGYAQFLNLWGNDFSKADWEALTQNHEKHAHNNFLEFGFRYGIPVALLHLLIELYAGIIALKFLFSRKYREPYHFFTAMCVMMFAVESLIEIATLPFERHAPFFFYMALVPIMCRKAEDEERSRDRGA